MLERLRRWASYAAAPGLAEELRAQREAAAMTHEQLLALQLAKLNCLLDHWRGVDWYARLLAEHGAPPGPLESLEELARLPVVTKEFVLSHGPLMASAPGRPLRKQTSGSSGRVFTFYVPRSILRRMAAAMIVALGMVDCDFFADRRVMLWHWTRWEHRRLRRVYERVKRWTLCTRCIHVFDFDDEQASAALERIARLRPKFVTAFAGVLYVLARAGRRRGITPYRPDFLLSTGETLLEVHRQAIEDYFQAPVYDRYGSSEFRLIAQQCPQRGVLHIAPTRLYVENSPDGELLITDLDNTATPFIRYAIGDAGRVGPSRCPCGRAGQAIDEVSGRVFELITTPSGKLLPGQFWGHMCWMTPGVEQYQVVQTAADRVQLRLVPDERFTDATAEGFRHWVRSFVGDEIDLDVVTVDRIEPGPGGKRRFVIRMDQEAGGAQPAEPADRQEAVR